MRLQIFKLLATFATVLIAMLAVPQSAQGQTLQIDAKTADCIEGFADFMRWDSNEKPHTITIGVIGATEVANYLRKQVGNRTVEQTPIEVVSLSPTDSFESLDIIFIGQGSRSDLDLILKKSCERNILSIGNQDGFIRKGGCVEFTVQKNRLRFYIDVERVKLCGQNISSKLLELALEPKR